MVLIQKTNVGIQENELFMASSIVDLLRQSISDAPGKSTWEEKIEELGIKRIYMAYHGPCAHVHKWDLPHFIILLSRP